MPYVLVCGIRDDGALFNTWEVYVTGLKASEHGHLTRFGYVGSVDGNLTLRYKQHPCVILNALDVLGYKVTTTTSISTPTTKEYMWTMRREFEESSSSSELVRGASIF